MPATGHECVCKKVFATRNGLQQHLRRRYCRGPPTDVNINECPVCNQTYDTYTGMRLHYRRSHPADYNNEMQDESAPKTYGGTVWSEEQLFYMARVEKSYSGRAVNSHIREVAFPTKTIDAIKSKRRTAEYREILAAVMGEPDLSTTDDSAAIPVEQLPSTTNDLIPDEPNVTILDDEPLMSASVLCTSTCVRYGDPIREFLNDYMSDWNDLELELLRMVREAHVNRREEIRDKIEEYINQICCNSASVSSSTKPSTRNNRKKVSYNVPKTSSGRKQLRYKLCQKAFKQDTRTLAECIIDDKPYHQGTDLPPIDEIVEYYKNIFSPPTADFTDDDSFTIMPNNIETYLPITPEIVIRTIESTRPSAPGPDGITLNIFKRIPIDKLVLLYNVMLIFAVVPPTLKLNRTVLISKNGVDCGVEGLRPLTIGSFFIRILHKIVASRLSLIPLCHHQRGFLRMDGTLANTAILQTAMKQRRSKGRPYNVIAVDIRKAFDTIAHSTITRALKRMSVDARTLLYVSDSYANCSTTFKSGNDEASIPLNRGVKQGDPLSPALFNLVMDELLCALQDTTEGIPLEGGGSVQSLAYADDIVLLGTNVKNIQRSLTILKDFLHKRCLDLNVDKCAALTASTVPSKKKLFIRTTPAFHIDRKPVRQLGPGDFFKYLGHKYSEMGLLAPTVDLFKTQLTRVRAAPLKPHQKVVIVKRYLLPRYIFSLQNLSITIKILKAFDRCLRITMRLILHLNRSCSDAFLHTSTKEGGLGFFSYRSNIPKILLKRLSGLGSNATDDALRSTLNSDYMSGLFEKFSRWNLGGARNPISGADWANCLERSYSGGGLLQGRGDGNSGFWVNDPPSCWSGKDYVNAVQLRGNLLPTRGIPSNPISERKCRAGCHRAESLSHVLQGCPATHWQRIRRHDRLVNTLKRHAVSRGWRAEVEPTFRGDDGIVKKPDLLFSKNDSIVICDVAIPWERPSDLSVAFSSKISTYSTLPFISKLQRIYPDKNITITALIISARGIWFRGNTINKILGISRANIRGLISDAMNGSILIHRDFNRLVCSIDGHTYHS